jgi:acyl dehydratase
LGQNSSVKGVGCARGPVDGRLWLASFGIAARSLIESCAERNPAGLVDIGVRFSSPVYPGETLETSIWKLDEPGAYAFQTKVLERDLIVLSHGTARVAV